MKRTPSYWWDFGEDDEIIVESDDDRFPVVGRFTFDPEGGVEARGFVRETMIKLGLGTRLGAAVDAIKKAEELIDNLKTGRVNPVKCAHTKKEQS